MTPRHDPIPTLPPMRAPSRRRRKRLPYWPFALGMFGVAIGAIIFAAYGVKTRTKRFADDAYHRAEQLFQSGAFHKAREEYELFASQHLNDPRVPDAHVAAELSEIAQSLDDPRADSDQTIDRLDQFFDRSGAGASGQERWPVILSMAYRSARASLEAANRSLSESDLNHGRVWLRWLHVQRDRGADGSESLELASLDQLAARGQESVAAERRRRRFVEAADRAIESGGAATFAEAFQNYEQWLAESSGADGAIQAKFAQLRQALRSQIQFESPPPPAETPPTLNLLPLEPYTLLATNTVHKSVARASDRPVFARSKDLCFAIDAGSGKPRWVARVGYDAPVPEMPRTAAPIAVVTWFDSESTIISACDAATGESRWSWRPPDFLSGPPAVTADSVFAATRQGSLWHLDLESGEVRGVAVLPEPIDSAPMLREDGRGVCVVGARQAVYLFDTGREKPECSDVVMTRRRGDTAHCQALWVPPYLVIFENDLVSRCFVRVLFQHDGGHQQVRQIELDGRVWQPPVLDGADILVITDTWKTHCFGLDPANPAVNLYTAATQMKATNPQAQPTQPYAIRVAQVPFVSITDALYGYRPDRTEGLIREVWSRPLPHKKWRSVQPLQSSDGTIVVTLEDPQHDGTLVQAFGAGQGELLWETRLAAAARDLVSIPGTDHVVVRTDPGHIFLVTRGKDQTGAASRNLELPAPASAIRLAPDAQHLAYAFDDAAAVQVVSTADWSRHGDSIRSQTVASEIGIYSGDLMVHGDTVQTLQGRWAMFITVDRTLNFRGLLDSSSDIHAVRLPGSGAKDEPWPWAPIATADSGVIAAHPRGILCRTEAHELDRILHLTVTGHRTDLPELVRPPVAAGNSILCFTADGRCLALDTKSLHTQTEWQAPAPIKNVAASSNLIWLCLADSTIAAVRYQNGKFTIAWQQRLDRSDWQLTDLDDDRLLAADSRGLIVAISKSSGELGGISRAPAALAMPPHRFGDNLVLATIDGGLFFVPAPN